jgi:predicted PurR-regulated permease PerM
MNCKLLAIWTSIILILWILLLYIVNMEKIRDIKEQFTSNITEDPSILNYQMGELTKNYDSIDELDGQLETNTRKLNLLTQQTNELNRVAYVFKYVTIISISLLILMICIFILNFDHISGPSAIARSKVSALFKRFKAKKSKRII